MKKFSTEEIIAMPLEKLEVVHQELDDKVDEMNEYKHLTLKENELLRELKTKRLFIKRWVDNHSER